VIKKFVHFFAVFAGGIITGGQYVVSFDYGTADVTASFYAEKMQYAIHHIGTPLFGMLIAATLLSIIAAVLNRKDNRTCYLILAAGTCFLLGGLITRFGNIPLLDIMDTWSASSPPANWRDIAERWYLFHTVRIVVDVTGFSLALLSIFVRRSGADGSITQRPNLIP
jgi:anthrone oxygenase-like protein